ncbi:MAG: thiamine-phosphate kinase [Planctomycetia bacterium TMED53]|nr:MAG: thiamine-phosphate kinase [Planctomycetia bacterium TMED53]
MNEREWVKEFILQRSHPEESVRGPGDDAAIFDTSVDHSNVISVDSLVSGQHFDEDWLNLWHPPGGLATRLIRGSLSDITAMGARVTGVLLSMETPELPGCFGDDFWKSFDTESALHQIELLGGNITRNEHSTSVHATVLGQVPLGRSWVRDSARPGDWIGVTGFPGSAAQSLQLLQSGSELPEQDPWRFPISRQRFALALQERLQATPACIDISDGLEIDLQRLCTASKVSATVNLDTLLASPTPPTIEQILGGGEDYELILGVDPKEVSTVDQVAKETGTPWHWIGQFEESIQDMTKLQWQIAGDSFTPQKRDLGWDPFRS